MEKVYTKATVKFTEDELTILKKAVNLFADVADAYNDKSAEVEIDSTVLEILKASKENLDFILK